MRWVESDSGTAAVFRNEERGPRIIKSEGIRSFDVRHTGDSHEDSGGLGCTKHPCCVRSVPSYEDGSGVGKVRKDPGWAHPSRRSLDARPLAHP